MRGMRKIVSGWMLVRCFVCIALCNPLLGPASAADKLDELALRIESGDAHSAVIAGLAVSVDGSRVATSSNDRTVRIWSMPGLRLVRTIFLPIGRGAQGAAYAVAFSPDGNTLAATGWTGSWEGDNGPWCFYVIDVQTGAFQRAVCDLPSRANHVTFSPDGRFFALALKDRKGLRVYRTSDYTLVAQDSDYPATSTWVEFDQSGRLITTCYDGKVRLYDKDFRLIASRAMPEGRRPDSLSFSPDGSRILVGYDEPEAQDPRWAPAVDVLSATDLSVLFRPDVRGVDNGALWRVAWSADGEFIYATGTWRKGNRYPVRRWQDGGRGQPRDLPGSASMNLRLRSVPSGEIVVLGEVPYIGVIGANNQIVAERQLPMADYTDIGDKLGVSKDGYSVQFAFQPSGGQPAHFSLLQRTLSPGDAPVELEMSHPVIEMAGVDVRDWSRGYRPTLNGKPLKMERVHEHALSLTFAPNGNGFLLGTVWHVIHYDSSGQMRWATPVTFNVRGVVVTADGRLAVAALGDGTLRWYAMQDGAELLAFFPHKDGKRWIAWTPKGYYTTSVGGERLIGWHVNRGKDRGADFFPVSKFRNKFHRPDIVAQTLAYLDEGRAIKAANADLGEDQQDLDVRKQLPAVVRVLSPKDRSTISSTTVTVDYSLRSPSGVPVKRVFARVNGQRVEGAETSEIAINEDEEFTGQLKISVPPRDVEIAIFAETEHGSSVGDTVNLLRLGSSQRIRNNNLYALVIGIGDYAEKSLKLGSFPGKDADDIAARLSKQAGGAFKAVDVKVLKDVEATLENIRLELAELREKTKDINDVALVYYSGHGTSRGGSSYLLPVDFELKGHRKRLDKDEILRELRDHNGRSLLFVDACHAADGLGAVGLVNAAGEFGGISVFASSLRGKASYGAPANSYFTSAVKEVFDGLATSKEMTAILDLEVWLHQRLGPISEERQTPFVLVPSQMKHMAVAIKRPR